jgi:hypothetical protein
MLEPWLDAVGGADSELLITDDGMLDIPWPEADTEIPCDILLATTNRPNTQSLSPEVIAAAWCDRGHRDYFDNNLCAGIRTFQDAEIEQLLRTRKAGQTQA